MKQYKIFNFIQRTGIKLEPELRHHATRIADSINEKWEVSEICFQRDKITVISIPYNISKEDRETLEKHIDECLSTLQQ